MRLIHFYDIEVRWGSCDACQRWILGARFTATAHAGGGRNFVCHELRWNNPRAVCSIGA